MHNVTPGKPIPMGVLIDSTGCQFTLFSRHATSVSLLLFEDDSDRQPSEELAFDPSENHTGDIWHMHVEGIRPGQLYLYRIDGPWAPDRGHRFNPNLFLLDPYAKATTGEFPGAKCIVIDDAFDWQGDKPLNYPLRFSVIYETHARGLSVDSSSGAEHPGSYLGVLDMIPRLKSLGITSVELLPVHEFNEKENSRKNPTTGEALENYWGYSTVSFFAPKRSYATSTARGGQIAEFKTMVRELHKAGIEVILDVVFNHTAEGNEDGPTLCFRGIDNRIYYILSEDKRYYKNFSGTGNTFNCNNPVVKNLIMDCLHYWVIEMHIDGFRFDLGSVLGRDQKGRLMENPPVVEQIAEDPILRNTKIIAEAWDAAGAYQVGWFPGGRWAEWNDRFRDDVRRFWLSDEKNTSSFATRLTGSSDLYLRDGRKPFHSINFVTSHDGFTLNDLVSYDKKHNEGNAEGNRDGQDANCSYNHGIEGESDDPEIEKWRNRQVKNLMATLLLSLGTPMVLGGDEMRRSQEGNNNAYCQNNPISWYDWRFADRHEDILRFTSSLIRFRLSHPAFLRPEFYTGQDRDYNAIPDISWFDSKGREPQWNTMGKVLGMRLDGSKAEVFADRDHNDIFALFNATASDVLAAVAEAANKRKWYRVIDTSRESPGDILPAGGEELLSDQAHYLVGAKSLALFISK